MREVYRTVCYVVPVAQPRQRFTRIKTKNGQGLTVNYVPRDHPVQDYKYTLRRHVQDEWHTAPLDGPLLLAVRFFMPRPARLMGRKQSDGPVPHTARPDLDNLIKATKDALLGLLWRDDAQVCGYVEAGKWYAEKDGRPRVELVVWAETVNN